MRTKIYYAGDKPSIQEVATVIAQEFKLPAEQLQPAYMPEGLAIAFIGTEDHNGKFDLDEHAMVLGACSELVFALKN